MRTDTAARPAEGREVYLDYLRVIAFFAVIVIHVSAQNWDRTKTVSPEWQTFNFTGSISRWSVPAFLMISGVLFLGRRIPLKRLWSRYILRMAVSFLVWSAVYACFVRGDLSQKLTAAARGHYHMWFILTIIGIYMCLPLLQAMTGSLPLTKYYLLLAFLFAFLLPEAITLAHDFGSEALIRAADAAASVRGNMNLQLVMGYAAYFVLGFLLHQLRLDRRQRAVIYLLGLLGFAFTVWANLTVSLQTRSRCDTYCDNFTVNVLLEALAVFTFFRYRNYPHPGLNALMRKLSEYTFGAYLVHALIIEQLKARLGLTTLSYAAPAAVFGNSLLVFLLSLLISALLHRIPVVRRYMV